MKQVTARAPGRVNIIGEHTDYTGGYVFPMAIEMGVTATVTKRSDQILRISSNLMPESIEVSLHELDEVKRSDWSDYVAGAVWSISRHYPITFGMDIALDSDLPVGAGMSSSAAVECSVILAVTELMNISPKSREMAQWAKDAENLYVGVPTGSMDQVASFFGKAGHALFFDTRDDIIEAIPIDLDAKEFCFAIIDTRAKHALIDGGYAARRADCEAGSKLLGVKYLRDLTDVDAALSLLDDKEANEQVMRRVRHVLTENSRVLRAVAALKRDDLTELGKLMNESHFSLRDDFEVSCPELDVAVEAALQTGALGARMMGGGFGGSAIALIGTELIAKLETLVARQFESHGFAPPKVYLVTASKGAHIVSSTD